MTASERIRVARSAQTAETRETKCPHVPARYYSWFAADGTLCICCCDCGAVLRGAA